MQRFARMSYGRWFAVGLFVLGAFPSATLVRAVDRNDETTEPAAKSDTLANTLRESVADEVVGDEKARAAKLNALIDAQPDAAAAHWQRGQMKTADGWCDAADCEVQVSDAEKKYRELRERVADDFTGNKHLARFCQKNKLMDNARGHWQRVLTFVPSDADARKALAHVMFEGTWTTKEDVKRVEKVRKEYSTSLTAWSKKIPAWINDWRSEKGERKEKGRENLLTIRDAAAIPLLQAGLAYRSEDDTVLLIEILRNIRDVSATRLMAETAVTNQSPQILEMCVEELKDRDENAFVPQLLLGLSSPITSEMRLEMNPNTCRILYRHVFTREGQFARQVEAVGRDYGAYAVPQILVQDPDELWLKGARLTGPAVMGTKEELDRNNALQRKLFGSVEQQQDSQFAYRMAQAMAAAMNRERLKAMENMSIEETNRRISLVLSKVFDENQGAPDQWWSWWNQRHETTQNSQKPTRTQVQYDQVVDGVQSGQTISVQDARDQGLLRHGCFVAGTPVATPEGLKPIESMKTGDLVLSQDIETGEITWKPVIQPTTRKATEILKLTIGDESVACSLKHPFWKTGRGWIWAKDLAVGDLVRTSNGSLPVTEIETQPDAPVFNLVVSDSSTYFVGKSRVLTHDITFRVPTLAIAPGVMPAKEDVAAK
jgi:hypothetical protein